MSEPDHVWTARLEALTTEQRADFENMDMGWGWPEVGSRMMTRVLTGQDLLGDWVVRMASTGMPWPNRASCS